MLTRQLHSDGPGLGCVHCRLPPCMCRSLQRNCMVLGCAWTCKQLSTATESSLSRGKAAARCQAIVLASEQCCGCVQTALTRTMNALGRKTKQLKEGEANLEGTHIREGLSAIISVKVPEPEFEGQTKTRLGNPEVRKILDSVITKVGQSVIFVASLD